LSLVSRVRFVIQEDRLYIKFVERRVILGSITDYQWFKNTMELIADMPKNWQQFCASDSWVAGFKKISYLFAMSNQQENHATFRSCRS
jgi:hypothetical protein